ncbi:MAG: Fe-S cluster assembly ATPase SufC [Mycoplasmataceae bacterium]|nr:Fe-S cluster assembly ATPase SufC [Mycoplasmataceae bacterium]
MLEVKNLEVKINEKTILQNINLNVLDHEIVALIGPNGCGKTTLLKAIFSHYTVSKTAGTIFFDNEDITNKETSDIANLKIHMMQQNPESISGLKTMDLLQAILKNENKTQEMSDFYTKVLKRLKELNLNHEILQREVNFNWSGGEKKKFQVLLMELKTPKLLLIDEIDTALDVDALKKVCELIKEYYEKNPDVSILVISHSNFIFNYLKPQKVYLVSNKTIAKQGDYSLLKEIQEFGYAKYQIEDEKNNDIANYIDPLKGK